MRKSVIALVALGVVIAVTEVYLHRQNPSPNASSPVVELVSQPMDKVESRKNVDHQSAELRMSSDQPVEPAILPAPMPASADTALSRTVDALVSTQTSFGDRQVMWQKLKAAGELDQVIAELKQRVLNNPDEAEIPTALGQAELQKADTVFRNGGSISEMGILGMQADQHFDAALKLDPANWEAQFFKAAAMSHWPAELNKGEEVAQRLSNLIDQQESMPAQPQFAQTYVVLGELYQKLGKLDYAEQTWKLGLAKCPGDQTLRKKISGQ